MRHHTGWGGELLIVALPIILLGFYWLFNNFKNPAVKLILLWLAYAPLTASIPYEAPHASRSIYLIIPLIMVFIFGMKQLFTLVNKIPSMVIKFNNLKLTLIPIKFSLILVIILLTANFSLYLEDYFNHYSVRSYQVWQLGNKYLANAFLKYQNQYQQFIFTNSFRLPLLSILFYNQEKIKTIQDQNSNRVFSFNWINEFKNLKVEEAPEKELQPGHLYLTVPNQVISQYLKESYVYPDGSDAVWVIARD